MAVLVNPGNSKFRELVLLYLWQKEQRPRANNNASGGVDAANDGEYSYDGDGAIIHFEASVLHNVQKFCDWLIEEISLRQMGRFLNWDDNLKLWTVMKSEDQIRRKISITVYNSTRRSKLRTAATTTDPAPVRDNTAMNGYETTDMPFQFLTVPSSLQWCGANPMEHGRNSSSRKRPRNAKGCERTAYNQLIQY